MSLLVTYGIAILNDLDNLDRDLLYTVSADVIERDILRALQDVTTKEDKTVLLELAMLHGLSSIMQQLVEAGADLNEAMNNVVLHCNVSILLEALKLGSKNLEDVVYVAIKNNDSHAIDILVDEYKVSKYVVDPKDFQDSIMYHYMMVRILMREAMKKK